MRNIVAELKGHLGLLQDRLECFCRLEVQLEGWFKGEFLYLLERMKAEGWIQDFDREVKIRPKSKKKIDAAIDTHDGRHWAELKYWFIGEQKGTLWSPSDHMDGLEKDVQ